MPAIELYPYFNYNLKLELTGMKISYKYNLNFMIMVIRRLHDA
jgi:hypothetical protein